MRQKRGQKSQNIKFLKFLQLLVIFTYIELPEAIVAVFYFRLGTGLILKGDEFQCSLALEHVIEFYKTANTAFSSDYVTVEPLSFTSEPHLFKFKK